MRELQAAAITDAVSRLAKEACYFLPKDVVDKFDSALESEESETGRDILSQLRENVRIADAEEVPLCQDTGFTVVFMEIGQDVHVTGGDLNEAVHEGVRRGYEEGYLRKSMVTEPFGERKNTGDNTPAIIHSSIVPGEQVKITLLPKGGGAENMSALTMLKPSQGRQGVVDFVLDTISNAGPNACPPLIIGVGVGGSFDKVTYLAKKAILREVGSQNPEPHLAELEDELERRANDLGIGPMGMGGRTTVMDVFVEEYPTHIAALPVGVNIQCHSARHKEVVL